jgi:hypothetical protein
MLQLTQINVYPVKSLDGYSPVEAVVEKRGLQYDRRWMITDAQGKFMSQRTHSRMALLRAFIDHDQLVIQEKQHPENVVAAPLVVAPDELVTVEVWNDRMQAVKVPGQIHTWLSDFLGAPCQLVVMPDTTMRRVDEKYNRGEDLVSFADGYPFLIAGEASMQDLNEKISTNTTTGFAPLSIRRFRANFIFSGGKPYQEDALTQFQIGAVAFQGIKPCARCVLITRDPDTGNSGKEPLATLSGYRQKENKVLFGKNIVWDNERWKEDSLPMVRVGDLIHF